MELSEYRRIHPTESVRSRYVNRNGVSLSLLEGMLKFDDSAARLAGPYQGGFAYFCVLDERCLGRLEPLAQLVQRARFSHHHLPRALGFRRPATSEEQLRQRLDALTPRELREWDARLSAWRPRQAWLECPFSLYLSGNDDSSWAMWFPDRKAADEEVELLLACQPLNMQRDILGDGFVSC